MFLDSGDGVAFKRDVGPWYNEKPANTTCADHVYTIDRQKVRMESPAVNPRMEAGFCGRTIP
jgi:hypothetical protein